MTAEPHDSQLSADLARLRCSAGVKWSRFPADVLPCWIADMDLPTAPVVRDALSALVERGDFGYHFQAASAIPATFSRWMAERHGWWPNESHVRVFCDVLQAVDLALWLGTQPGDGVVLLTPVYPPFFECITGIGRRVVDCPLDPAGWRIDAARLEACIDDRTTALLLCSPHNPTGRVFTREELSAVAEVAERHDLLVISDEIWADVVFSGSHHTPFASLSGAAEARTITAAAASKTFNMAGLRCAVAHIGVSEIERRIAELPAHLLGAAGSPGAIATHIAWTEGGPWVDETIVFLEAQRDHLMARLAAELPGVGATTPEATYLAWLDLRAYDLGDDPAGWLLANAKVALGPGPDFGEHGRGFARLNFATTRALLDEAVDRIIAALEGR